MTRIRTGAVVAVAAILFAACSGTSSSATPASQAPASQAPASEAPSTAPSAANAPKDGGNLVVAIPGDIASTDTAFIQDSNSSAVSNQVIEGLVGTKPGTTGEVIPVLAKSWTVSPDGLTYTFTLREGVKFHDGTDFNAEAVCYNYDRWKNFTGALASGDYSYYWAAVFGGYKADANLVSCTATSPTEAVLVLKHPYSSFLLSQTITSFGINSPTALKALDADNPDPSKSGYNTGAKGAMVGTGPFKFVEYVGNDHVTLEKNADYWNKDAIAHLDKVTFKPYPDQTGTLNALGAGDIDLALNVNPTDLATIQADPTQQAIDRGESCNLFHLAMNQTHKPFDNAKIREAVGYAINKQALIDTFYGGQAKPAVTWMPAGGLYAKDENLPTYDPAKAKALIDESGVPASELTYRLLVPVQRGPAVHAGPEGHLPGAERGPGGGRLQADPPDQAVARGLPQGRGHRQVPDVAHRLDLRLGGPGQLPRHRLLQLPGRQAEPRVRLQERRAQQDHEGRRGGDGRRHRQVPLGEGPGHDPGRPPDHPAGQLHPARRRQGLRQGLHRLGQPDRDLQHGLARQVARRAPTLTSEPGQAGSKDPGCRTGPRGPHHQPLLGDPQP